MVRDALHETESQFVHVTEYQRLVAEIKQSKDRICFLEAEVRMLKDASLRRGTTIETHDEYEGGSPPSACHASPLSPWHYTN